jgi:hypothetical protein
MRRFVLSIAFLGLAGAASAQAPAGPGWSAFSGCWTPVGTDGSRNVAANTPRVCVVPNGNAADLLTVVGDSITDRTAVDAGGQRHDVSKQGCSGWEKAEFSSDGRRLYISGEQSCAGGLKRVTSGVFAIASNGDWISAVDVAADSVSSVRVIRYAPVSITPTMPASIRELQSHEVSDRTARISAQRDVSVNAVIEASRFLSPPAEEAWLAELEQDFNLDDKTLARLADEKVAPSVIDVMVAVSNPDVFSVRGTGSIERNPDSDAARERRQHEPCFAPVVDPWAWYAYDPCDPYLRFSYYRPNYYRYGYPYYGYGYGYGGGGYYYPYDSRPVIIVPVSSQPRTHGRMTKDGYKSGGSSSDGSSASGASSSRGDTKAEGGRSSSGNGGRTATRKPPRNDDSEVTRPTSTRDASSTGSSSTGESSRSSTTSPTTSSGSASSSTGRVATRKPPTA